LKNNRATSFRCLRAGRESKILKLFPAGGDHGVRDFMVALDGATGKLVCRKYVIPAPGEPGSETWKDKNNAWQTGGGAMWVTGSYDAAANQVLWGIGNPVPMYEPGVLDACKAARKTFETVGCVVEEAQPDYPLDSVWRALLRIRGWQQGGALLGLYNDRARRAQLKPEAIYEIETGMMQSAYDISAASVVRSEWYQAVRRFLNRYNYFIVPTAQLFPFDVDLLWPQEIAGKRMETYHEWMKAVLLISMSGCPALAVPAGFGSTGLPIGVQITAPDHRELDCLQLAYAYTMAANWTNSRLPVLLAA
jgi:Asp-tRNA(Asn)/Glu-tRNA(Gln) amidotransferase A subunit family amidase